MLLNGEVDLHVRAISDHIVDTLKKEGVRPHHVEGKNTAKWVLIDYIDVIVHLFIPDMRQFYNLENLWIEADPVKLTFEEPPKPEAAASPKPKTRKAAAVKPKPKRKATPRREPEPST